MMNDPRQIIDRVLITEKGTVMREKSNQYLFRVAPSATKIDVKRAVEQIFSVKVADVRTMNLDGKPKRVGVHKGRRSAWKKAIVTLAAGQTIELIENI